MISIYEANGVFRYMIGMTDDNSRAELKSAIMTSRPRPAANSFSMTVRRRRIKARTPNVRQIADSIVASRWVTIIKTEAISRAKQQKESMSDKRVILPSLAVISKTYLLKERRTSRA